MIRLLNRITGKIEQNESSGGHAILIACFPKSGSTYISSLLASYTGYRKADFVHSWGAREQELEPSIMNKLAKMNVVVQQHTKASEATLKLIDLHQVKVIVLVRNIFDVILSLRDHLIKDPRPQPVFDAGRSFHTLGSNEQLNMIIDLGAQWYIHFYVSWYRVIQGKGVKLITYESFFEDIEAGFSKVCESINTSFISDKFEIAKEKTEMGLTRLNVGEVGRGQKILSEEQKSKIIKLAAYYPEVDFSLIGI